MWTLFLIQTNDTIHVWQSSNWIFLTSPFTSLFSTSLCHQLTLQPRMASSGILDLSFPPLRFYNYTTHLQSTPPPCHSKEKWWIVCSWMLFEKSKLHIFIRALGDCWRRETIVTLVPFPGSTSKVAKWEQQHPAALKGKREWSLNPELPLSPHYVLFVNHG